MSNRLVGINCKYESFHEGGRHEEIYDSNTIVIVLIVFGGVVSVCRNNNGDDKDGDVIPDNAWDAPTQRGNAVMIARMWMRTARWDANDYIIEEVRIITTTNAQANRLRVMLLCFIESLHQSLSLLPV